MENDFIRPYIFTNEYLRLYYALFNLVGKKVLTVGSSGDQAFNAYHDGADDIVVYDISPYTQKMFDIKYAALKRLSYKEFKLFFKIDGDKPFDYQLFQRIKISFMNYQSLSYWDGLFEKKKKQSYQLYDIPVHMTAPDQIVGMNNYLFSKENYEHLKEELKLKYPIFINDDILNIDNHINLHNFDFVNLSNIYNSIGPILMNQLIEKLKPRLNPGGIIIVNYVFFPSSNELKKYDFIPGLETIPINNQEIVVYRK